MKTSNVVIGLSTGELLLGKHDTYFLPNGMQVVKW